MSYITERQKIIWSELRERADRFARAYDPSRPSVILVPGGMGSRLYQSTVKYAEGTPFPNPLRSRRIWLSFAAIFRGELVQLRMTKSGRDTGSKPIFARGELDDLGLSFAKRYDQTAAFFKPWANYMGMGYDWRRSAKEAAKDLQFLLTAIRQRVKELGHPKSPLPNLTILAHSMGGLVSKLLINNLLDSGEDPKAWCHRLISVGTPFYGTYTHMPRYYVGTGLLNVFMGGAANVAELISTLPGPYILMPAPQTVLAPRLSALGLSRYPVRDWHDPRHPADPFDTATRSRFPALIDKRYITRARREFAHVDRPVPQAQDQIFHIRSNDRPPTRSRTDEPLEVFWQDIDGAHFDHAEDAPLRINQGAGDGTVPFWSARLATTPSDQVINLERESEDDLPLPHGELLEIDFVLDLVKQLIEGQSVSSHPALPAADPSDMTASTEEVERWIDETEGRLDDEEMLMPQLAQLAPRMRRALEREMDLLG